VARILALFPRCIACTDSLKELISFPGISSNPVVARSRPRSSDSEKLEKSYI
jgi:hypothetical protein